MRVRNINGTKDADCKCGSWLNHWEKFSNSKAQWCSVKGCSKKDLVGAHVQKENVADNTWYIIPLCNEHNLKLGQTLEAFDVPLVAANKQETCERTMVKLRVTKKL